MFVKFELQYPSTMMNFLQKRRLSCSLFGLDSLVQGAVCKEKRSSTRTSLWYKLSNSYSAYMLRLFYAEKITHNYRNYYCKERKCFCRNQSHCGLLWIFLPFNQVVCHVCEYLPFQCSHYAV